jgi:hypothetical protein
MTISKRRLGSMACRRSTPSGLVSHGGLVGGRSASQHPPRPAGWTSFDGTELNNTSPQSDIAAELAPSGSQRGELFTRLDLKGGVGPVYHDPAAGQRAAISIGGQGAHARWTPGR